MSREEGGEGDEAEANLQLRLHLRRVRWHLRDATTGGITQVLFQASQSQSQRSSRMASQNRKQMFESDDSD